MKSDDSIISPVLVKWNGCPCCYTTPCHPNCTCVFPKSSLGCSRCCSYGSIERKQRAAKRLVQKIDAKD